MAGGVGERFWPLSRAAKPKHLWNITGGEKCLLSQTLTRTRKIAGVEKVLVITNKAQVAPILKECPEISEDCIVAEPMGRDTSAAVALAALLAKRLALGEESSFCVLPADQVVEDEAAFARTLETAFAIAENSGELVTIGINPTHPATGYGYIERGEALALGEEKYFKVSRFHEKPALEKAKEYLAGGGFYWNAGIFVWKTSSILGALAKFLPAHSEIFSAIETDMDAGASLAAALENHFPKLEKISIDFGVMEKADNVSVVPAAFDWDDVGSWTAVERHAPKDASGNVLRGETYLLDTHNCTIVDESGRATVLLGVRDLVVVHTPDATLICPKERCENIKDVLKLLPARFR